MTTRAEHDAERERLQGHLATATHDVVRSALSVADAKRLAAATRATLASHKGRLAVAEGHLAVVVQGYEDVRASLSRHEDEAMGVQG